MTLPASGIISLGNDTGDTTTISVNRELAKVSPYQQSISLDDAAVRVLFGVASGTISMSNGYGKSNTFEFFIGSTGTGVNLRTLALAAGWNGTANVLAKISIGVPVSSSAVGTPAITIDGSFPNGVKLSNSGTVSGATGTTGSTGTHGARGLGGISPGYTNGPPGSAGGTAGNGGNGSAGGISISTSIAVTIDNLGTINGGAGGNAGSPGTRSGGGGGAGGGYSVTTGGGGKDSPPVVTTYYYGGNGGNGYSVATGAATAPTSNGGAGGNGPGLAGSAGGSPELAGGAGGAGGAAGSSGSVGAQGNYISGNSNVTWINNGTRTGGVA
jgi:hypothetical protein